MEVTKRPADLENHSIDPPPRKRFKASDLPLTQAQRTAIDAILHTFKKKGEFDILRKKVYAKFEDSDAKHNLLTSLTSLAENELERNPALLGKDRRQAAPLIEGAAERSEIYRIVEADIDGIIDDFVVDAEEKLREIRRMDVGQANATEEQKRGSKSEEEYARESTIRRHAWAKMREEELERQLKREEEEEKRREEERQRKQAEEELRERERAIEREKERKRQEEWERELEERRERKKRQDAEWERERLEKEERARKKREAEREKEIEAAALEELLREGKRLAAKSGRTEDMVAKDTGSKESALAAIMKAEKLERERAAKSGDEVGTSTTKTGGEAKEDTVALENTEDDHSGKDRSTGAGYLYKSNVWIRDGQRPKQASYKRETLDTADRRFEIIKSTDRHAREDTSHREERQRNISSYRDDRPSNTRYQESSEKANENHIHEGQRTSNDFSSHGPSPSRIGPDVSPHKPAKDLDRSSRHVDDNRRTRSPSDRSPYHKRDGGKDDEPEPRRHRAPSRSRSASRRRRTSYRERSREDSRHHSPPRFRRRSRSRDPKDIDRYVPSSSARGRGHDRDRDRSRERDRPVRERARDVDYRSSNGYDRHRDYERGIDDERSRERERNRDKDRDGDRSKRGSISRRPGRESRDQDVEGGGDRERDVDKSSQPVHIDRYMPSTSYRAKRGELDAPAIARTHALAGSQKERRRSRSKSRSRSRSRKTGLDEKESRSRSTVSKN